MTSHVLAGECSVGRPPIVCLCGSTRFKDTFVEAGLTETLAGRIVVTIGSDLRSDPELFGHLSEGELRVVKARLDVLHFAKIDLADECLFLNVDGYIGESTRRELEYAAMRGKRIRWWDEAKAPTSDGPWPYQDTGL